MGTVSGDNWVHARNAAVVNGVEYFNYSNHDIIVTDRLGTEIELLRCTERPERLEDRGKVIVRVTRLVDPRRVKVPSLESRYECDRVYLVAFKECVEKLKASITTYVPETTQVRMNAQVELHLDFIDSRAVYKSELLGITVRETSNVVERTHGNNPIGYINDEVVKELSEIDHSADGGQERGIRTLFSARLIDNRNRIGTLWTTGFGDTTEIIANKDEEQEEGLYLAGGLRLQHRHFIPIADLLDSKKLLTYNLHHSELEAKRHSTGVYTTSVTSENEKLKKEKNELKTEKHKLTSKVSDLETKLHIEKVNKAHGDFKQTVTLENMKEYRADNYVSGITRLITLLITSVKSLSLLMQILKA